MKLEYLERFLNSKKEIDKVRESSLKSYYTDIKLYMEQMEELKDIHAEIKIADSITRNDVEDFIYKIKDELAETTVNRKITSLKGYFAYLYEEQELISRNVWGRVKQIKKVKVTHVKDSITREQIEKLLSATYIINRLEDTKADLAGARTRALISILATTGCRINEILNTKIKDLEVFNNHYAVNLKGEETKNHVIKRIVIGNKAKEYLDEYLQIRKTYNQESEYLIANNNGRRLDDVSSNIMFQKYMDRAKIDIKLTNHCFRGYFRTTLSANGVNENIIKLVGGWQLDKVSRAYVKSTMITDEKRLEICNII